MRREHLGACKSQLPRNMDRHWSDVRCISLELHWHVSRSSFPGVQRRLTRHSQANRHREEACEGRDPTAAAGSRRRAYTSQLNMCSCSCLVLVGNTRAPSPSSRRHRRRGGRLTAAIGIGYENLLRWNGPHKNRSAYMTRRAIGIPI